MKNTRQPWPPLTILAFAIAVSLPLLGACSTREFNAPDSNAASVPTTEAFAYGAPGKDPAYDEYEKKLKAAPPKGF